MLESTFSGIVAYTVTPFSNNEQGVNLDALYALIDQLIHSGANVIAALGSAGECAYLNDDEWKIVAMKTVDYVNKRVPVIVGIADLTTAGAVAHARLAQEYGADAIMVSPFSYYRLSEAEIYDHYAAISDAISIPIMIYNNPATCSADMSPAFMLSMVENIENATMIKESSGDILRMRSLQRLSRGTVPFFNGCNYLALDALNSGATGWCTAAPCLLGNLPSKLFKAVKQGDIEHAKTLFKLQLPLLEFIVAGGLAPTVKAGLEMKGLLVGNARRPLKPLKDEQKKLLAGMMAAVEVSGEVVY